MSPSLDLDARLRAASPAVRGILEGCLGGVDLAAPDAIALCGAQGADLDALCAAADRRRAEQAGEIATYVVNRNVNFTNVCVKTCKFCAFSRKYRSEQGYLLPIDEVVRRAVEARDHGATEVCLQAGLAPGLSPTFYLDLLRAVRRAAPELHVHAFSPEEVKYGAELAGRSWRDYLAELRDAGLGSLPGTSAEVLDDAVRRRLASTRLTTAEWCEIIRTAHSLGLPTTATLMFGHIESDAQRVRHLALLRELQRETGGFTEIVPLSFIHAEAPAFVRRLLPELRPGASEQEVIRLYAIARLMLGSAFRNLQVSWVKQGLVLAARILGCGANDLGGTLINESISTSAGAPHGQLVSPARLRAAIRAAGRVPAERSTLYAIRRVFSADGHDDPVSPLDAIADPDAVFGSYAALVRDERFRFRGGPPGRRADGWLAAAHRAGSRAEALDEDAPAGTAAAD